MPLSNIPHYAQKNTMCLSDIPCLCALLTLVTLYPPFYAYVCLWIFPPHSLGYRHRKVVNEDSVEPVEGDEGEVDVTRVQVRVESRHLVGYQVTQHALKTEREKKTETSKALWTNFREKNEYIHTHTLNHMYNNTHTYTGILVDQKPRKI